MEPKPKHMRGESASPAGIPVAARLLLAAIGSCLVGLALCFVAAQVRGGFSAGGWLNRFWFVFFAVTCFVASGMVVCREWLATKPERVYLVIVLSITTLFSWSFSVREPAWDVGIHYRNTVRFADWEGEVESTPSDEILINKSPTEAADDSSLATVNAQEEAVDTGVLPDGTAQPAGIIERITTVSGYFVTIEYYLYSLVMFVSRLLGASPSRTLFLVRLAGGWFYSVVTFLGMRKLRHGKMLYAALALLPTSVFLVADLSYSYWLFSLCLYGFATLAGMMQGSVEVTPVSLGKMLGALFVGMLPRVAYFPLMFLCLLIPTKRFSSVRAARVYRGLLVGTAALAFAMWLVPRLLANMGPGDTRGGTNVSPSGQIAYICAHPLDYARTFLRFVLPPLTMQDGAPDVEGHNLIGGYLSIEASPGLLTNYGYLPRPHWAFAAVLWVVLLVVLLTDRDRAQRMGVACGVASVALTFAVFFMITTALYFDFTPVGLPEIHGVQRRYLLPLLFPLLVFVGPRRFGVTGAAPRVNMGWYNGAVLGCMAAVLLGSFWLSCVALIV